MTEKLFTAEQEQRIREIIREEMDQICREPIELSREQFEEMAKRAAYKVISQVLSQESEDPPG